VSKSAKEHKPGRLEAGSEGMKEGDALSVQHSAVSNKHRMTVYVMLITAGLLLFTGCTQQEQMYKESRVLMDTYCTITVVSPSKENARSAIDAGFEEIKKLEDFMKD